MQASLQWGKKDGPVYVTEESGVVGLNFHQSKEVLMQDTSNGVGYREVNLTFMISKILTIWFCRLKTAF